LAVGEDQCERQQDAENCAHGRMDYHLTEGRVFLHNKRRNNVTFEQRCASWMVSKLFGLQIVSGPCCGAEDQSKDSASDKRK
jgi:hypothetical protein